MLDWVDYLRMPIDEGAIVAKQPQCASNIIYVIQHFLPRCQPIAFYQVDVDDSFLDSDSQVVHNTLVEGTLAKFEKEIFHCQHFQDYIHYLHV